MYLLTKTTQSFILKPTSADALHWTASWVEVSTTGPTIEEKSAIGISTSTSTVTMVPAPSSASKKHHVKSISLRLTRAVDVSVCFKEDSTEAVVILRSMDVDFTLHYEDGQGWYLIKPSDA